MLTHSCFCSWAQAGHKLIRCPIRGSGHLLHVFEVGAFSPGIDRYLVALPPAARLHILSISQQYNLTICFSLQLYTACSTQHYHLLYQRSIMQCNVMLPRETRIRCLHFNRLMSLPMQSVAARPDQRPETKTGRSLKSATTCAIQILKSSKNTTLPSLLPPLKTGTPLQLCNVQITNCMPVLA